jgi:hypothetical protein
MASIPKIVGSVIVGLIVLGAIYFMIGGARSPQPSNTLNVAQNTPPVSDAATTSTGTQQGVPATPPVATNETSFPLGPNAPAPGPWYYVDQNYDCVEAPYQYRFENSCAQAVGTGCYENDPTCGGNAKEITLYYINSSGQCVVAPHNPYSPISSTGVGGIPAEEEACEQDVGQYCYPDDSTCDNAEAAGTIVLSGEPYTLVTASELVQNGSNPGPDAAAEGNPATSTAGLVAVEGTVTAIITAPPSTLPSGAPSQNYDVIVNTADGYVVQAQGGNNTFTNPPSNNGFNPTDFPVGTKVIVGGVFVGRNVTLQEFVQTDPQLAAMNLPADTPILVNNASDGVEAAQ